MTPSHHVATIGVPGAATRSTPMCMAQAVAARGPAKDDDAGPVGVVFGRHAPGERPNAVPSGVATFTAPPVSGLDLRPDVERLGMTGAGPIGPMGILRIAG